MIHCQNVWLQYRRQRRLRQALKETALAAFTGKLESEDFWGLRDVSFEVKQGQVMGVVGVNGSGKTSLLKILGGVLTPDRGSLRIDGRVCPLLEVGTGFEPELSGSDNIYLNGAVLGIPRKDLRAKYKSIVEFAELEYFIDTPLKHYSTGMKMRLGFAIAMHGNPEVLLVDEVLAVGDLAFQKKCIDAIGALRSRNVTILFVSHSMDTVKHLCNSAVWLHEGEVKAQGPTEKVVEAYFKAIDLRQKTQIKNKSSQPVLTDRTRQECPIVIVDQVKFLGQNRKPTETFHPLEEMTAAIYFTAHEKVSNPIFGVGIHRSDGIHICGPNTGECDYKLQSIEGKGVMEFHIPSLKLLSGVYYMTVGIFDEAHIHAFDYRDQAFCFEVQYSAMKGHRGLVAMDYQWRFIPG